MIVFFLRYFALTELQLVNVGGFHVGDSLATFAVCVCVCVCVLSNEVLHGWDLLGPPAKVFAPAPPAKTGITLSFSRNVGTIQALRRFGKVAPKVDVAVGVEAVYHKVKGPFACRTGKGHVFFSISTPAASIVVACGGNAAELGV